MGSFQAIYIYIYAHICIHICLSIYFSPQQLLLRLCPHTGLPSMGQSFSTPPPGSDGNECDDCNAKEEAKAYHMPPDLPSPEIVGVDDAGKRMLVLTPKLAARLADALPPSCRCGAFSGVTRWYLLYSSYLHGKSFQRLVQRITSRGPTIIVIKVKDSPRVLGAFCESDWLTVAQREKNAKSAAAASARATREGQKQRVTSAPEKQSNTFFGNVNCFVFRAYADGTDDVSTEGEIYHSHSSMNSNFMYLFDTHPLEEKIGIGMGGQPGYYGFFIDRWLENGASHGARCTTFQNPRLSSTESWVVESVEVYAVKKDIVEQLLITGSSRTSGVSCVNDNPDSRACQMLLELNGTHEFNRRDRTEC
ncbi:conserved hypothetical protein [Leishmania infantum JPCM5]|uniref:Oxidation resistance protein 1 n=2 Tax=Leishmania infantum TaxID=5671 RepID=E9AHX4_LEIIN|nr:conserved hypothetical protein [Leishmania infantum JPCM5]CBZ09032.1 conserved hypothetical protein [Leishmania infantum JPCM5]|eukprot:XP_003392825.1 conserved hypothetical protein [Leishmania infantum JPCM5]